MVADSSHLYLGEYVHASDISEGPAGGLIADEGQSRPLSWTAVSAGSDRLDVLSTYVLDAAQFSASATLGSFDYTSSTLEATFSNSFVTSTRFTTAEGSQALIPPRQIQTALYDKASGEEMPSGGSVSFPTLSGYTQAWALAARTRTNFAGTGQVFASPDNAAANQLFDAFTTLRDGESQASYWTRSPHYDALIANNDHALYVDSDGRVKDAVVTDTFGLRPALSLNPADIVFAHKIVPTPTGADEMAAQGLRDANGKLTGDGAYPFDPSHDSYKLTVIDLTLDLESLAYNNNALDPSGTSTIYASANTTITLDGAINGDADHLSYKIVKQNGNTRQIVGAGNTAGNVLYLKATGLDGQTPLAAGSYDVSVWAQKDKATSSHAASEPISFSLVIDNTAPVSKTLVPAPVSWQREPVTVALSATDELSGVDVLTYTLNDSDEVRASTPETSLVLAQDGKHELVWWATDKAGNVETTKSAHYYIDATAPVSFITAPGTYEPRTIEIAATDPAEAAAGGVVSGVREIHYSINEGPDQVYSGPIELGADGTYRIGYWSEDVAGNVEHGRVALYTIKAYVAPLAASSVSLSAAKATVVVGNYYRLKASVIPAGAAYRWVSSNPAVATVASDGTVRAHKAGKATITAVALHGSAKASFALTVENKTSDVRTTIKTLYVKRGSTLSVPVIAYAKDDTPLTISWSVKKYGAATVVNAPKSKAYPYRGSYIVGGNKAKTLKIKGIKAGKATITLKSRNGQKLQLRVVVVKKSRKLKSFKISSLPAHKRLEVKKSDFLSVKLTSGKATGVRVKWKSSRPSVVKVDSAGKITALKRGRAVITATIGKKRAKVTITSILWAK
jgi:uncharacterized protein YjdB